MEILSQSTSNLLTCLVLGPTVDLDKSGRPDFVVQTGVMTYII